MNQSGLSSVHTTWSITHKCNLKRKHTLTENTLRKGMCLVWHNTFARVWATWSRSGVTANIAISSCFHTLTVHADTHSIALFCHFCAPLNFTCSLLTKCTHTSIKNRSTLSFNELSLSVNAHSHDSILRRVLHTHIYTHLAQCLHCITAFLYETSRMLNMRKSKQN